MKGDQAFCPEFIIKFFLTAHDLAVVPQHSLCIVHGPFILSVDSIGGSATSLGLFKMVSGISHVDRLMYMLPLTLAPMALGYVWSGQLKITEIGSPENSNLCY